jgi:O-antigen/teichoic acid export membrane protein
VSTLSSLRSRIGRVGSAVSDQALLSATNLLAGVMLIRSAGDRQYGYYVLATNAVLLLITLQNGFFGAPMINRLTPLPPVEQGRYAAGLNREQRRLLLPGCALVLLLAFTARAAGLIDGEAMWVAAAFALATIAMLGREFYRMVLLAHRRTGLLLRTDLAFAAVYLGGIALGLRSAYAGGFALLALTAAAAAAGLLLARHARRESYLAAYGPSGALRQLAPVGAWAAAGGAIHWIYGQGYSYLVAGSLDVAAVAAVSATRLLMMPLNLVASGVSQFMLPTAAAWLHRDGPAVLLRRLLLTGGCMCLLALAYVAVVWQLRGWIFGSLLHKGLAGGFADRDLLFCLWAGIFGLMVVRDQLLFLPVLRERFRTLAGLSFSCAALAVALSWPAMRHYGAAGALVGMLAGEILNIAGIAVLALREARLESAPHAEAVVGQVS